MFLNVITYEYVDFYSALCLSELFSGLLLFCDVFCLCHVFSFHFFGRIFVLHS